MAPATTIETITPEDAAKYLARSRAGRTLRETHVDALARDMACGRWVFNGASICFDAEGCLIDGQHRLSACVNAALAFQTNVTRGLPVGAAMATIDVGKARNPADVLRIAGVESSGHVVGALRSVALMLRGQPAVRTRYRSPTPSEIVELAAQWSEVHEAVALVYKPKPAVLAAARIAGLATYLLRNCEKNDVGAFFTRLNRGAPAFGEKDPVIVCREWHHSHDTARGNLGEWIAFGTTVCAWNAYVEDRELVKMNFKPEGALYIAGCPAPWAKGQGK